jgi:hypothetical protein
MTTFSIPSSFARKLLAMAGLGVLCATVGCQLSQSDVVKRSPDLVYGLGGSSGQDAIAADEASYDADPPDLFGIDRSAAAEDTPDMDDKQSESGPGTDAVDVKGDEVTEAPRAGETGGDADDLCSAEGYEFCERFENGAASWVSTGGPWDVSSVTGSPDANSVFGPLIAGASIAYAPDGVWQDMTAEADVMVTSFGQMTSSNRAEVYARYQKQDHFYAVSLRGDGKLGLRKNASGLGTTAPVSVAENQWHTLKIRVYGIANDVMVEGYLDGTLVAAAPDTDGSPSGDTGTVAVGVYGGALAVFDNVRVSSP